MDKQKALQLKERSTGLIAILTDPEESRKLERSLTLHKVIKEAIPISEVQRYVGMREIAIAIDIQLTRLVASLNFANTLNDRQIKIIVEDLIDKYPNESIEDFVLCFKKARLGELGKSYNHLDSEVIFEWMKAYLLQKYELLEDELKKEKDNQYALPDPGYGPGYLEFKKWAKDLADAAKVPGMTDADYRKYGQEKPVRTTKTAGYAYFKVRNVQVMATSQQHAEELVQLMIDRGDLIEDVHFKSVDDPNNLI